MKLGRGDEKNSAAWINQRLENGHLECWNGGPWINWGEDCLEQQCEGNCWGLEGNMGSRVLWSYGKNDCAVGRESKCWVIAWIEVFY